MRTGLDTGRELGKSSSPRVRLCRICHCPSCSSTAALTLAGSPALTQQPGQLPREQQELPGPRSQAEAGLVTAGHAQAPTAPSLQRDIYRRCPAPHSRAWRSQLRLPAGHGPKCCSAAAWG